MAFDESGSGVNWPLWDHLCIPHRQRSTSPVGGLPQCRRWLQRGRRIAQQSIDDGDLWCE